MRTISTPFDQIGLDVVRVSLIVLGDAVKAVVNAHEGVIPGGIGGAETAAVLQRGPGALQLHTAGRAQSRGH